MNLAVDVSLKARTIFEEAASVAPVPKTAPVLEEKPFLAKQFKRTVIKPPAQSQYGPWLPARAHPPDERAASPALPRRLYQQHFDQEHILTMSKMSLFGLISGLMLLGILFFMVGFLVALGTLEPAKPAAAPPPSSWSDMNSSPGKTSRGAQAQRGVFANMAQQQLSRASSGITKFVPQALRPLAQQAKTQASSSVRNAISGKKTGSAKQQQQQPQQEPEQQPGGATQPGPGGMQQAPGMQQPWPQQQQQMAQPYTPPPVSPYASPPPPPAAYAPPPAVYTPPPYLQR